MLYAGSKISCTFLWLFITIFFLCPYNITITFLAINLRGTFGFWKSVIFSQCTWFLLIMWAQCHTINYPSWFINGKHWFQLWGHVLLIQMSDTGCKPPFYHVNWRRIARTWDQQMGLFVMLLKLNLSDTGNVFQLLKMKGKLSAWKSHV